MGKRVRPGFNLLPHTNKHHTLNTQQKPQIPLFAPKHTLATHCLLLNKNRNNPAPLNYTIHCAEQISNTNPEL